MGRKASPVDENVQWTLLCPKGLDLERSPVGITAWTMVEAHIPGFPPKKPPGTAVDPLGYTQVRVLR